MLLFSRPLVSNSLWPHGLQHARPLCPSPSPQICLSSCPLYWWYHPAISSSDALFSLCPQSFPASGTFPMNQQFTLDDQNIGVSTSVVPMNIQGWFPLRLTGLITLVLPLILEENLFSLFSLSMILAGEGQGSLARCSPWGQKKSDMIEQQWWY